MTEERPVIASLEPERLLLEIAGDISVPVAARILGITRRHLRRLLRAERERLSAPRYRIVKRRVVRVLSAADVRMLWALLDARRARGVKGNPS